MRSGSHIVIFTILLLMGCGSSKRAYKKDLASFNGICRPLIEIVKDSEFDFAHTKGELVNGNDTGLIRMLTYSLSKVQVPGFDHGTFSRSDSGKDYYFAFKELTPSIYTDSIYNNLVKQLDFCFRDFFPVRNRIEAGFFFHIKFAYI